MFDILKLSAAGIDETQRVASVHRSTAQLEPDPVVVAGVVDREGGQASFSFYRMSGQVIGVDPRGWGRRGGLGLSSRYRHVRRTRVGNLGRARRVKRSGLQELRNSRSASRDAAPRRHPGERGVQKRAHPLVQLGPQPRDLALGLATDAHSLVQVVHGAGGHAVHVRLRAPTTGRLMATAVAVDRRHLREGPRGHCHPERGGDTGGGGQHRRSMSGHRHEDRPEQGRDLLDRLPAQTNAPRPAWHEAGDLRRSRGPEGCRGQSAQGHLEALPGALHAHRPGLRQQRPSAAVSAAIVTVFAYELCPGRAAAVAHRRPVDPLDQLAGAAERRHQAENPIILSQ